MTILTRITSAYNTMSKSHRDISYFIQENREDLLFDSLAELSCKVGKSEATVVRFAQGLGYSGYSDMQDALRIEVRESNERSFETEFCGEDARIPFMALADEAANRVREMYRDLDTDAFERACDLLMCAESLLVIGYMDAFGVGAQALHSFDGIRPNVRFCRLLFETNEVYRHIHKNTAIVAFSFAPHYKFTFELLQIAAEKDCRIVLISDSPINQLAPLADSVLCAGVGREKGSVLMDMSAPIHLLYMLSRRMALKYPEQVKGFQKVSLRRYEEFLT